MDAPVCGGAAAGVPLTCSAGHPHPGSGTLTSIQLVPRNLHTTAAQVNINTVYLLLYLPMQLSSMSHGLTPSIWCCSFVALV